MLSARRFRRLGEILVVLTLALVFALAQNSFAYTQSQAVEKATRIQSNDCRYQWPILFKCIDPLLIRPSCIPTGIDQAGEAQWRCGGVFSRFRMTKFQLCHTTYLLSPWGRELYGSGYVCYLSLVS